VTVCLLHQIEAKSDFNTQLELAIELSKLSPEFQVGRKPFDGQVCKMRKVRIDR
jgi:hypothetical protein